jgi:phosphinothricin acetyltransferase
MPEMEERINKISAKHPYLVWDAGAGEINGYAYIHSFHERSAYRYSLELSIYLRNGFQGRGMGKALMEKLLEEIRKTDTHAMMALITLPNEASVGLHEKFGFKKIAHLVEIGRKFDRWLDVGYWELILR